MKISKQRLHEIVAEELQIAEMETVTGQRIDDQTEHFDDGLTQKEFDDRTENLFRMVKTESVTVTEFKDLIYQLMGQFRLDMNKKSDHNFNGLSFAQSRE